MMFSVLNSDLKDKRVVKLPGPAIRGNANGKTWITLSAKLKEINGIHTLWLRFSGNDESMVQLDWFQFVKQEKQ